MKQIEIVENVDAILALLPAEMQINVALRYEGTDALKKTVADVRAKLETLRAKLLEKT